MPGLYYVIFSISSNSDYAHGHNGIGESTYVTLARIDWGYGAESNLFIGYHVGESDSAGMGRVAL